MLARAKQFLLFVLFEKSRIYPLRRKDLNPRLLLRPVRLLKINNGHFTVRLCCKHLMPRLNFSLSDGAYYIYYEKQIR